MSNHATEQTPVHDQHNPDLLKLMPLTAQKIIEVGCSSGALAREYKRLNPKAHYTGIEVVASYAQLARRHCDRVIELDLEDRGVDLLQAGLAADCWVFGDVLEHLRDPWNLLSRIRRTLPANGMVLACIPNAQHWSIQARLNLGDFRYAESGLLDRTHIRWFTRQTMFEMFQEAGFTVETCIGRVFEEPMRETFLPAIRMMAAASNNDPELAANDALPLQFVLRCQAN